jgi:hypothetical protein
MKVKKRSQNGGKKKRAKSLSMSSESDRNLSDGESNLFKIRNLLDV